MPSTCPVSAGLVVVVVDVEVDAAPGFETFLVVGVVRLVVEGVVVFRNVASALGSIFAPLSGPDGLTPGTLGACGCAVASPVPSMSASSVSELPITAPRRTRRLRRVPTASRTTGMYSAKSA